MYNQTERLLYKNSCNISSLINLITIHEESTSRYLRQQNSNETQIVNLLNNVFTQQNINLQGHQQTLNGSEDPSYNVNSVYNNLVTINNDFSAEINPDYLTLAQFQDISQNVIYTTCPISREVFNDTSEIIIVNKCKHYFKKNYMIPWIRRSNKCPYCRTVMDSFQETTNSSTTNLNDN